MVPRGGGKPHSFFCLSYSSCHLLPDAGIAVGNLRQSGSIYGLSVLAREQKREAPGKSQKDYSEGKSRKAIP